MRGALGLAFLLITIPAQGHDHSRCVVDARDREVCLHNAARRIATTGRCAQQHGIIRSMDVEIRGIQAVTIVLSQIIQKFVIHMIQMAVR